MGNRDLTKQYIAARKASRLCSRCGWIIYPTDWRAGSTLCRDCSDALKGVNISWGHYQPLQEPVDLTGEAD